MIFWGREGHIYRPVCCLAGDYEVSVMFDDEHVSQSPFYVSVSAGPDKSLAQGQNCSGMNYQCFGDHFYFALEMFECVGLMALCFFPAIDHNQMCNRYEEPSLSETVINTTSDSSAEPVFLSDASKVICHGPSLSKGFLGRKNTFYVDCSKAGECSLTLARMWSNSFH